MPTNTQKSIAGALLLGASALTGNATLIAAAQGVGGNWTSEGLLGLWSRASQPTPRAALLQAGETAIQRTVDSLQHAYRYEDSDTRAFALVRECAPAVAVAQYPAGPRDPLAAQQALAASLGELLHGHAARQFLENRLLDAVSVAFREALVADDQAWRLFYGWLLEQLAGQNAAMLQDQERAFAALQASVAPLHALLAELHAAVEQIRHAPASGTTFENSDMEIGGDLEQAGQDIYQGSSVAGDRAATSPQPGSSTSFKNTGVKVTGNATQAGRNIYRNSAHAAGAGSTATVQNSGGDKIDIASVQGSILNAKSDRKDVTQSIGTGPNEQAEQHDDTLTE